MPAYKVYDETNYRELLGTKRKTLPDGWTVPVHVTADGQEFELSRYQTDTGKQAMAAAPSFGDNFPVYPRSEWPARIKEQKEQKRRVSDFQKFKAHAQTGPTCWANGPAHAFTTQRVIQGLPLVYMSANSVSVPISGGNSGGDEWEAGKYALDHGWVSVDKYDNGSRDRGALNSAECQESRKHHKGLQLYSLSGFDEFATACLMSVPFVAAIAYNWWSHVISMADLFQDGDGFGFLNRNNWGDDWGDKNDYGFGGYIRLREGHGTPSSGFVFGPVLSSVV